MVVPGVQNAGKLIAARRRRGLTTLGPTEARVVFDASAAFGAGVAALAFFAVFITRGMPSPAVIVAALGAPVVFLVAAALTGIYSRLRSAPGRKKAIALAVAITFTAVVLLVISRDAALVIFWSIMAGPPIVLARLLLAVAHGSRRTSLNVAVNDRGPILVIGGAGYIGSHAVEQLLARGRSVRVLDRLMHGGDPLADFRGNARFEFIEGDAADISKLTTAMRSVSGVVHLAGLVGDPACAIDAEFTRHTNIVVTRMVRTVAQSMGVRRFVFASSCSVYGVSDHPVDELSALSPVSLYAQTKIDSERELLANVPDDFFITVLRFATVFGHSRRPRFDLVGNLFAAQAIEDGLITVVGPNQWRPFIHVRDLGRAIAETIEADPVLVQSQIFNVGDERLNMTILQLAQAVQHIAQPYRPVDISVVDDPNDKRNYAVSFSKIHSMLGFRAETLLDAGIRELIDKHRIGTYAHYRADVYSNVAMTRRAVERFQDPDELSRIWAPLSR